MTDTVKTFFDSYAAGFDAIYGTRNTLFQRIINKLFRKSMRLRFDKVIKGCEPLDSKTLLDVGCGPGLFSVTMAKGGLKKAVGIDFAEEMISIANTKAKQFDVEDKCQFITIDAMKFNSDEKFDYTIVMGVMDYIENAPGFIQHLKSMTKGKIFLSFPVDDGLMAAQRRFRYRKRCPLYMYTERSLDDLLMSTAEGRYKIEKIARDFFVTINV